MSTTEDKHQAADKGLVVPLAFCMACDAPASSDGRGNWWHTDGNSSKCNARESVKQLRFSNLPSSANRAKGSAK